MSNIVIKSSTTGTGTYTIEAPVTNTDRVLTLPADGVLMSSTSSLSSANLTGALPAIDGGALTNMRGAVTYHTVSRDTFPALLGPITYHNVVPLNSISLSPHGITSSTIGILVSVFYLHSGSTNHGYWSADLYQSGDLTNRTTYKAYHYDFYYNSDFVTLLVPWSAGGVNILNVQTTESTNTSSGNAYYLHYAGRVDQS